MSKGPTPTGSNYKEATKRQYISLSFIPRDWCTYPDRKNCPSRDLICDNINVCLLCKYRKELDIPEILNNYKKDLDK
jgi:hypothetical protein